MHKLHLNVNVEIVVHFDGRVLVVSVPSRPIGSATQWEGVRWMREGSSLIPISDERFRAIFEESGHDMSADICKGVSMEDLDPAAIEDFRWRWTLKSGNTALARLSHRQLLEDAEAVVEGRVTYAALILFGSHAASRRHLAHAEVVFEYRASWAPGPAQQRTEHSHGFFG